LAVEGATTKVTFEAYLEHVLAPILAPGRVAVMDNLSAHKGGRVRQIVEGRGCEPLYLPPTRPTSTRSSKRSRRSRRCYGVPKGVPARP
jgi:transposase